jgi:hypothetical protein
MLNVDFFSMIFLPSASTVLEVSAASEDRAKLGYGIGIGGAGGAGVLQTSGKTGDWPVLPACTSVFGEFTVTVAPM